MSIAQSEAVRRIVPLDQVPTLPEVITRLLSILEDDTSCVEDVTEILAADPVITARILHLANAPFFGSRFEIDNIHRAIVTVGFEAVKHLALATCVLDSMARRPQPCLNAEAFWMHALGTAKAAQLLAFSVRDIPMPEACFTAGLLHDLGKYILAISVPEDYSAVLAAAQREEIALEAAEQRLLNTDHAEVGGWLASHWHFPANIVEPIRYARAPERHRGQHGDTVYIVSLANEVARLAAFGDDGDPSPPLLRDSLLDSLDLQRDEVAGICETLETMKNEARALLGLLRDN